jgi:GxxExxY protein
METNQEQDPISHAVIGRAMEAHRTIGPGLKEPFYHQELGNLLTRDGIEHLWKPRREFVYRGHVADVFEPDLVVANHLIPELKSLRGEFAPEHFTQLLTYCKFWRLRTGMLFVFGKPSLLWKRTIYTLKTDRVPETPLPDFVSHAETANRIIEVVRRCLADIGLGYPEGTWYGLISAALLAEQIPFVKAPVVAIKDLGTTELKCLVIDQRCAVSIGALGTEVSSTDRGYLQTCLRWLDLDWGIAFHFGKSNFDMRIVSRPQNS